MSTSRRRARRCACTKGVRSASSSTTPPRPARSCCRRCRRSSSVCNRSVSKASGAAARPVVRWRLAAACAWMWPESAAWAAVSCAASPCKACHARHCAQPHCASSSTLQISTKVKKWRSTKRPRAVARAIKRILQKDGAAVGPNLPRGPPRCVHGLWTAPARQRWTFCQDRAAHPWTRSRRTSSAPPGTMDLINAHPFAAQHPRRAMSQNTHTLHLFFQDPVKLKLAQLIYRYLATGHTEQAQRWADRLGASDLHGLWDAQWFNQEVFARPAHLTLRFDTGTSDGLPLHALETLFAHGLQAAVLEVFYDQVGETERMHFDAGQWVSRQAFIQKNPQWLPVVEHQAGRDEAGDASEGDEDADYGCSKDPVKPLSVAQLRKQEAQRKREAQEAVEAFVGLAQAMGKSGTSPVQGVVAVLLLRAGLKGLLQAFVFTVLAVLLFKGFWLWLGLGLVLAVVLPLYYMLSEYKTLKGDNDDSDADGEDGGPVTVMASH